MRSFSDRNGTLGDDGGSAPIVSANAASNYNATSDPASSDRATGGDTHQTTARPP